MDAFIGNGLGTKVDAKGIETETGKLLCFLK